MKEKRIRDKQMIVRFTERELAEFSEKMSRAKSKSRSDFIMSLVRSKPIFVLDGLPEITAELKRQGNNLNQITRLFNQTKSCPVYLETVLRKNYAVYDEIHDLIASHKGEKRADF